MDMKLTWSSFKMKMDGARKSLTVFLAAVWSGLTSNIDSIQPYMSSMPAWFGDHLAQVISTVFGLLIIYVRLYRTSGPIEDKVEPK